MTDDLEGLAWGEPFRARRWHIFDGHQSLCGSWAFGSANQPVEASDTYSEGDDCKACCRKAGLLEGNDA
ncbi:hypothetical protein [Halorubrum salinum]|uniref:hypothetical protein n=1 Tax=Halorubrum salinum TaxID=767517 RepID=UPI0021132A83|nr:hypothetical protein [Halorubrum salinum]